MDRWEYYTPAAIYNLETEQWTMEEKSGESLMALLNGYGAAGWELVSVTAEYWYPVSLQGGGGQVYWYRAFFKRRVP